MEVKLSAELQAKLDSMAAEQGRDSASLVHEAVERLIGYDEWFIRQVEEGLAQIAAGPPRPRMTWKTLQIISLKKHRKMLRG